MSGATEGADALYGARDEPDPSKRSEIRDEVRIVALLLIAQEMEMLTNAIHTTMQGIDHAIAALIRNTERDDEEPE